MWATAPGSDSASASRPARSVSSLRRQRRRLGKAAVEVPGPDLEAEEREIREVGIERGLRVAGEEPRPHTGLGATFGTPRHGQARMGQGVALAAGREQQRAARIGLQVEVWAERRESSRSGVPSTSVATVTSEAKGAPPSRSRGGERPRADLAQQRPGQSDGVERRLGGRQRRGLFPVCLGHAVPPRLARLPPYLGVGAGCRPGRATPWQGGRRADPESDPSVAASPRVLAFSAGWP